MVNDLVIVELKAIEYLIQENEFQTLLQNYDIEMERYTTHLEQQQNGNTSEFMHRPILQAPENISKFTEKQQEIQNFLKCSKLVVNEYCFLIPSKCVLTTDLKIEFPDNDVGFHIKAFLSLLLLNILTLSTAIPLLLQALVTLKMPPLLVSIFASMYRYIGVLTNEFKAMHRAATARNFAPQNLYNHQRDDRPWQRQVLGNMLGVLFIRTYDRGDRIYQAMLARGYQGTPIMNESATSTWRDRMAISYVMIMIIVGKVFI